MHARVEREARRRHVSVSAIVRDLIAAGFPEEDLSKPRVIPFAGIVAWGGYPTGADVDEYLAEHWAEDIERHRDR